MTWPANEVIEWMEREFSLSELVSTYPVNDIYKKLTILGSSEIKDIVLIMELEKLFERGKDVSEIIN